jgi:hypothetical protein
MIPEQSENPNGLHGRYIIQHADGSPTDPNAVYFVLRLDKKGRDELHTLACRYAARAYSRFVTSGEVPHLSQVGVELEKLCDRIESK